MKLNHWLLILGLGCFISCQNSTSTETDREHVTSVVTTQQCYTFTKNRDTATMTTMSSGHIVTGELHYQLYEKDSNHGTIKGEMRGDTLVADYTFASEGRESVRQVAFLKKDGKLLEGYGEVKEADGKTVFKNLSTITFGNAIEFEKISCN